MIFARDGDPVFYLAHVLFTRAAANFVASRRSIFVIAFGRQTRVGVTTKMMITKSEMVHDCLCWSCSLRWQHPGTINQVFQK